MSQTSGLTVRQHEREGIELPVEFHVCPEHGSQVQFSPASSSSGQHIVRGKAVDISSGGIGIECRQFIPRGCEGLVRVLAPDPLRVGEDGAPVLTAIFEHRVKVRRVYMIGREPLYALGGAFVSPNADIDQRIAALLAKVRPDGKPALRPGRGGGANA